MFFNHHKKNKIWNAVFFSHLNNYLHIAPFRKLYFYHWHYYRCSHFPTPLCHIPTMFAPPSLWPSPHGHLCLWVMHVSTLANPFTFLYPVLHPFPSYSCQSVPCVHASVSILLLRISVCFFVCLLYSTYKWDLLVFVFIWLAYVTRFTHAVANGKMSFFMTAEYSIVEVHHTFLSTHLQMALGLFSDLGYCK